MPDFRRKELSGQGLTSCRAAGAQVNHMDKIQYINPDYQYFNIQKIKDLAGIPYASRQKGERLLQQGCVSLDDVRTDYDSIMGKPGDGKIANITGTGLDPAKNHRFYMSAMFTKNRIISLTCLCPECLSSGSYGYSYFKKKKCSYMSAFLDEAGRVLSERYNTDATDYQGAMFLDSFRQASPSRKGSPADRSALVKQDEEIQLVPRLAKVQGHLELSFKIGSSKKFQIRNLHDFCDHVRNKETAVYGSKTEISHDPDNFTPDSRRWLSFIQRTVQEDRMQFDRISDLMKYGRIKSPKQSIIPVYGWRLDQLWQLMQGLIVEYEDKDDPIQVKQQVSCREGNPYINVDITRLTDEERAGPDAFEGISVYSELPASWEGVEHLYFMDAGFFLKADREFSDNISAFSASAKSGIIDMHIGRFHLTDFYHRILPELKKFAEVTENDSQDIIKYVPPAAAFTFYLDYLGDRVQCRAFVSYGEDEYDLADRLKPGDISPLRQIDEEDRVLSLLISLFPDFDRETGEFLSSGDDDMTYMLLSESPDQLKEYGQVMCTSRFRDQSENRTLRVTVGVSVSEGLLNLEITTDDVSREELLEILKAYHPSKKYYRLSGGSYLDMQSEAMLMLNQLITGMNMPLKDILKEKINIPVYRTLYLDTLLEENQSVYSHRDRNFRSLVRNFHTIGNADFDEPRSLSDVMRPYQTDGFKWLKTLESYGFGGILADDMGLGKTLQAIALLLSHREEMDMESSGKFRKNGLDENSLLSPNDSATEVYGPSADAEKGRQNQPSVSLVVAPASLVFNWTDELNRFAPQLKVTAVTGSQGQRRSIIESCSRFDVAVTSYDLLKRDIDAYENINFYYEIIDEAQYIKNHTTAAAKAVKVIHARRRLALTGTPVENRLSELWSIFDFLMPGFLYGYETFRKNFELPIVKGQDEERLKRLRQMVSPFILRRLKGDVLRDLPDKLEETRMVQFDEKQQKLYDAQVVYIQTLVQGQGEEEFKRGKMQLLAELTKLRQICCHPSLCFDNYSGPSAKLESCLDLVKSAMDSEHRILLFSQFTSMLEIIARELKKSGISFYTITGATPKEERLRLVKAFNENDVPVFLISLKAGGTGLNLTGADIVIHYDPWWNVAAQNQATDRAHRIGQTRDVTVYKMITKNSIEESIQRLQETKQNLADSIINAADGTSLGLLSREDLLELLN